MTGHVDKLEKHSLDEINILTRFVASLKTEIRIPPEVWDIIEQNRQIWTDELINKTAFRRT